MIPKIDGTHDATLRSWVESANDPATDFPVQNLPLGVFRRGGARPARVAQVGDWLARSDRSSDAGAGLWVPPGDSVSLAEAIRFLASRPQEGREMGMRGRQYVEAHFDRAVLAEQLSKHFLELKV